MQLVLERCTIRPWRLDDAKLSRGVAVHHAHFTVDLVVAFRLAKDGIRIRLRSLFCVCAA